tara:strand:+ start:652 stop:1809 length:1158 start_codon:yes stop_codon:yes gene_type:complete
MIPYSTQEVTEEDIKEVTKILRSDFLTQGPKNIEFENLVAKKCNVPHALTVNSASSALHIACLALELGSGDIFWTSAISFVASANCAIHCGASIDFIDINPLTYNISIENLEEKLILAKKSNRLPKIIMPVHLAGQSCDMEKIYSLSIQYGFKIIEDASHSIGSKYNNVNVGSCKYSDIAVFSFHPVKIITTGEGGMLLTKSDSIAKKIKLIRTNGITKEKKEFKHENDGPWYYEQQSIGFNYRMNDIQAALGSSQLNRLEKNIDLRHKIAKRYDEELKELPLQTPYCLDNCYSSYHLYIIQISINDTKRSHKEIFEYLRHEGIGVNLHYIPIYRHPYYQKNGFKNYKLVNSENYYSKAISLPIFPMLNNEQQDTVISKLKNYLT